MTCWLLFPHSYSPLHSFVHFFINLPTWKTSTNLQVHLAPLNFHILSLSHVTPFTLQHHLHASLLRQISPHTVKPATTFLSYQRTACIFYFFAAAFNIVHFSCSCLIKTISFPTSCTSDFNTQRSLLQRGWRWLRFARRSIETNCAISSK